MKSLHSRHFSVSASSSQSKPPGQCMYHAGWGQVPQMWLHLLYDLDTGGRGRLTVFFKTLPIRFPSFHRARFAKVPNCVTSAVPRPFQEQNRMRWHPGFDGHLISLSQRRDEGRPPPRKTRFRLLAPLCRAGFVNPQGCMKGFRVRVSFSLYVRIQPVLRYWLLCRGEICFPPEALTS